MHLTLRELLKRLPRYVVMVNPSKIKGGAGEWQSLSAHDTVLEALRQCSGYMGELKLEFGVQLTSMEADVQIEPWIVVVDRVQSRTVVWITDAKLHVADGVLGQNAPSVKPGDHTAAVPPHLLRQASSSQQAPEPEESLLPLATPA